MAHKKPAKITSLIFCAVYCLVIILCVFLMDVEADHDCTGDSCPICTAISVCMHLLKNGAIAAAVGAAWRFLRYLCGQKLARFDCKSDTPTLFSLKVMLLN